MEIIWSRRRALQVTSSVLGLTILSGCLSGFANNPDPGALVIDNNHSEEQTVTVAVTKTNEDESETRRHDQTPLPETTPIWERDEQFTIGAGETLRQESFLTETGAFYLEVRLENGEHASNWVGLYEAAGGGVAEDAIYIDIYEVSRVTIYPSHSD